MIEVNNVNYNTVLQFHHLHLYKIIYKLQEFNTQFNTKCVLFPCEHGLCYNKLNNGKMERHSLSQVRL